MVFSLSERLLDEMKQQEEEKRVLPPGPLLRRLAHVIKLRQEANYDAWILVTGDLGKGKSTLSIQLMRKVMRLNKLGKWKFDVNVLYNPDFETFQETLLSVPERSAIVVDEAMTLLSSRNWNSTERTKLISFADRIRYRKLCVIFNLRLMREVDVLFRVGRFIYWIDVLERGIAALMSRMENYAFKTTGDAYGSELLEEATKDIPISDIEQKMAIYEKMPNFRGWLAFSPLSPRLEMLYEKWKDKKQREEREGIGKKKINKNTIKTFVIDLFEKGFSVSEIKQEFNKVFGQDISDSTIRTIIAKARGG